MFLPALLLCSDFRLEAELRWGLGGSREASISIRAMAWSRIVQDTGTYVPAELTAFVERFRQVAPAWEISEATDIFELGREGSGFPTTGRCTRRPVLDVFIDVVGFWKKSSLERLTRLLPVHGPPRFVLAISDRLKVDEEALQDLNVPVLRFKEIPNATELAGLLDRFLK